MIKHNIDTSSATPFKEGRYIYKYVQLVSVLCHFEGEPLFVKFLLHFNLILLSPYFFHKNVATLILDLYYDSLNHIFKHF